jgi:glycosyltransferase involved in cell wall biosynthesis
MRICVVASSRFPIAEPFAGGLEAWTHTLVSELHRRGHDVTLFAAPGSDPSLPVTAMAVAAFEPSRAALRDVNSPPWQWLREHHAYLGLMLDLAKADFDVIHNGSLHHLPVAMADTVPTPMVTTLHTPPLPWLESAIALADDPGAFVAVSQSTALAWSSVVPTVVIRNGVDVQAHRPGPGGGPAVWTGRMVAEKAPHHAIEAARLAGVGLVLAGPLSDPAYFEGHVAPLLGGTVRYAGHLRRNALIELMGQASVALVTPEWDEPYGLVAAEAMACGTPVAAYDRGALSELVLPAVGELVPGGDTAALAAAVRRARHRDRRAVRRHAERHCSLARMADDYERLYSSVVERRAA